MINFQDMSCPLLLIKQASSGHVSEACRLFLGGSTGGRQRALRARFLRFSVAVIQFIPYCYAFSARYPWKYRASHAQLAHGLILHERGKKSVICSIDDFFQV